MKAENSARRAGAPDAGTLLDLADHRRVAQQRTARSRLILSTISAGVRTGASEACTQPAASKPGSSRRSCRNSVERRRCAAAGRRQRAPSIRPSRIAFSAEAVLSIISLTWPPQQVGHRRTGALVGDVLDVDLRLQLEQLHAEMLRRAETGRRVGQLAGFLARELDQLAQRLRRKVGMRHDHQRHREDVGDRLEVDQRLVGQVGIEAGLTPKVPLDTTITV